jgi:hypothetical protein
MMGRQRRRQALVGLQLLADASRQFMLGSLHAAPKPLARARSASRKRGR